LLQPKSHIESLGIKTIRNVWDKSTPFAIALERYAPSQVWEDYQDDLAAMRNPDLLMKRLAERADNPELAEFHKQNKGVPIAMLPALMATLGGAFGLFRKPVERAVEDRIFSGELIGIGFSEPRCPDEAPHVIERDVWLGKVQ